MESLPPAGYPRPDPHDPLIGWLASEHHARVFEAGSYANAVASKNRSSTFRVIRETLLS